MMELLLDRSIYMSLKIFRSSDKKHDGKIDRKEFETLIKGYFELKGIQPTKENFDQ